MESKFAGYTSSKKMKDIYLDSLGQDYGQFNLGKNTTKILIESPRNLLFTLSRYKFVAKMFEGFEKVLEIGCQEGFGAHLVANSVKKLNCIDFYKPYIDSTSKCFPCTNTSFEAHDILDSPYGSEYDGVFALDVLEHIQVDDEKVFIKNTCSSLSKTGTLIIGMPTSESQIYASRASKIGHVNCKSGLELKNLFYKYFNNVFLFSMNDEVLHTGFHQMSHYIFVLCSYQKNR